MGHPRGVFPRTPRSDSCTTLLPLCISSCACDSRLCLGATQPTPLTLCEHCGPNTTLGLSTDGVRRQLAHGLQLQLRSASCATSHVAVYFTQPGRVRLVRALVVPRLAAPRKEPRP